MTLFPLPTLAQRGYHTLWIDALNPYEHDYAAFKYQSELVFHNSVSAEEVWKPAVPYWDLVPFTYLPTLTGS